MKAARWTLVTAAAMAAGLLAVEATAFSQTPQPSPSPKPSESAPPPPPPPGFPDKPEDDRKKRPKETSSQTTGTDQGPSSSVGSTTPATAGPSTGGGGDDTAATGATEPKKATGKRKERRKPTGVEEPEPTPTFAPLTPAPVAQDPVSDAALPTWLLLLLGASLAGTFGVVGWLLARRRYARANRN